jgi:hypothetical protein
LRDEATSTSVLSGRIFIIDEDPFRSGVNLDLGEALRVLEALEDARDALRQQGFVPGLQDELATMVRILHGKLGLDEGGLR